MASVIDAYPECINNYLAMVCIQSFPKCTSTTDSTPLYPCRSLCLSVSSTCFDLFKQLGQTQNLPDCSAHIPSLSINYPLDASQICVAYNYAVGGGGLVSVNNPFAASTTSTTITSGTSTAGSSATSSATTTYSSSSSSAVTCNTPLIHVPLANQTSAMTCVIECCLPCPILDTFYPVGTFENYFKVTDPFSYLSFILMVFMSASFTFLPSKNKKSARVLRMLFYSLTILSARTLFAAGPGGLRSIQCVDALTMSNQGNNGLCSAQGTQCRGGPCLLLDLTHSTPF